MEHEITASPMRFLEATQKEPQPGLTTIDGQTITAKSPSNLPSQWPELQPIPASVLVTMKKHCELLKLTESLKFLQETEAGQSPVYFSDGTLSHWEFNVRETGRFQAVLKDFSDETKNFLHLANIPASIREIRGQIEALAKLKAKANDTDSRAAYIGFLSTDLNEIGVSAYVLAEVCKNIRQDPSPFLPSFGEFLKQCKDLQECYIQAKNELEKPKTIAKPAEKCENHAKQAPTPEEISAVEALVAGLVKKMQAGQDD